MQDHRDTIFALSSGLPPAAIAVVRISGPRTAQALTLLSGRVPQPRRAALARIRDPRSGEMIDEALALWFPAPNSETGEDVAELQVHGGRAVVAAVLAALGRIEGLRLAEGGEFTRRGFENGKLDLTAVEGLGDLIAAETEAQRRQAFRQMKGLLGERAEAWRTRLIEALALVEARIDFSDEADVPEELVTPALAMVRTLRQEVAAALADAGRGERLRDGVVVAIAGPPNAGKSSLLNRLAQREAAIVSPYAGTTRDVIEVHLDLGGFPVTLLDTAGIRPSDDPVEQEGVRRARERAAAADLVLWLEEAVPAAEGQGDGSGAAARAHLGSGAGSAPGLAPGLASGVAPGSVAATGMTGADPGSVQSGRSGSEYVFTLSGSAISEPKAPVWKIRTKVDLLDEKNGLYPHKPLDNEYRFDISVRTGYQIQLLEQELGRFAADALRGGEPAIVTRQRHRAALETVVAALDRALVASTEETIAEELRAAATALGRLTGRIDVEDVLDVIFRDFCIGK